MSALTSFELHTDPRGVSPDMSITPAPVIWRISAETVQSLAVADPPSPFDPSSVKIRITRSPGTPPPRRALYALAVRRGRRFTLVVHDVVLTGGRVLDPQTGLDRVCDVGLDGGSVTAIGEHLDGATNVDARGLVVAPGFVDLHSHAQSLPGRRLQACDGVTTALDLEAGR